MIDYIQNGDVLVLHTPIIKYIFEIHLGIICIAGGKNGKENMKGSQSVILTICDWLSESPPCSRILYMYQFSITLH